jgi:hypothetical protein
MEDKTYKGAPLTGIAVGNGCTGNSIGICGYYFGDVCEGLYYSFKYLIDLSVVERGLKNAIEENCDWKKCTNGTISYLEALSVKCLLLLDEASLSMGAINIYNVYGSCVHDECEDFVASSSSSSSSLSSLHSSNDMELKSYASHTHITARDRMGYAGALFHRESRLRDNINRIESYLQNMRSLASTAPEREEESKNLSQNQHDRLHKLRILKSLLSKPSSNIVTAVVTDDDEYLSNLTESLVISTDDDIFNITEPIYGPVGCIVTAHATHLLTTPAVLEAIHVKPIDFCWAACNQHSNFTYDANRENLPRDTYPYLISKIKVLIFNGDMDACVPFTDNEAWTQNMGYPILKHWRPWHYSAEGADESNSRQIGGYSIKYNVSKLGTGSFEYRTVRGAGHMVPTDAPRQGFFLFSHLLDMKVNDTNFITYTSDDDDDDDENQNSNEGCDQHGPKENPFALVSIILLMILSVVAYLLYKNGYFRPRESSRQNSDHSQNQSTGQVAMTLVPESSIRTKFRSSSENIIRNPISRLSSTGESSTYIPINVKEDP